MANLRRHFNFSSSKSSVHQEPFSISSSSKTSHRCFDKHNLMNDICNCLDLCCSYIQALNSLCFAGSSLARNLFHTVRDVPAYHNISQQFLSVWEEVSKATAGASAAVKTETLMMLQEILNTLEMGTNEVSMDDTIAESFQVIGTCLCSFIELQAQFSWSTWKSLSKLSKNFTSDSFRHSLQWKSLDRSPSKISVNADLNATIKKHFSQLFCKVGISKVNETVETTQSQFYTTPIQGQSNISVYSPFGTESVTGKPTTESVWSSPTTIWPSSDCANVNFHGRMQSSEQDCQNATAVQSDLDEVINLLSCVPVQQSGNKINCQNQNYFCYPTSDQMYHLLPKGSTPSISRQLGGHRSWSKESRDIALGYDSWIWRTDNMNCAGLPAHTDVIKMQADGNSELHHQWENKELQNWNSSTFETGSSSDDGSSIHGPDTEMFSCGMSRSFGKHLLHTLSNRRHNNGESMPGGLENVSESREECTQEVRSKISTWPLKQSTFRSSESECHERTENCTYQNFQFMPS